MKTQKLFKVSRLFIPLAAGLLSCNLSNLYAQTASEDYSIVTQLLGQGNASVNGSQALKNNSCVPTSVANGLSYLNAYQLSLGNPSPFAFDPNNYGAVNHLQSFMATDPVAATQPANALSGLQTYLTTAGPLGNPAPGVSTWQTWKPSAQSLADVLNAHDGVQLGIFWQSAGNTITANQPWSPQAGGHFVSLQSIDLTDGSGTIGIVDPWGNGTVTPPVAGTSASYDSLDVSTVAIAAGGYLAAGNYLKVTYHIPVLGDFPNIDTGTAFAGAGGTGLIALSEVEAVPEPSSLIISILTSAGVGGFMMIRRRK